MISLSFSFFPKFCGKFKTRPWKEKHNAEKVMNRMARLENVAISEEDVAKSENKSSHVDSIKTDDQKDKRVTTLENTNSSSSPTNPKISPGLAKAIAEGTLKFPEGQPEPTFFHCAVDDCGYKSYGEIAQKYEEKKEPEPEEDEEVCGKVVDCNLCIIYNINRTH